MADLVLDHLTIRYGGVTAVNDVSITVPSGEFLTLLGPSGCGKSTTLFSIAGLNKATSGTIRIGDTVLFDGERGVEVAPERRNIGLVFQSYALWPHKTVAENLAFPLQLRRIGRAERDEKIAEALGLVEMTPYADRYPFELSGGQQQRVALARALVYRPGLLLLDEPLSALDLNYQFHVMDVLRRQTRQHRLITLVVLHDLNIALRHTDHALMLHGGAIEAEGLPAEVVTPATLRRVYRVQARVERCPQGQAQVHVDGLAGA